MLIPSHRHSTADLARWRELERADAVHCRLASHRRRVAEALAAVRAFAAAGPCYAGVSWGKDSAVLADMVAAEAPGVPLVWVCVEPVSNPDCVLVRDTFLAAHPWVHYEELRVEAPIDADGEVVGTGRLEAGFRLAAERFGARYLSGVRGSESAARAKRVARWGLETERTCAPLGRWSAADVFAYLHERELPVHPAYACLLDGLLDRERIRVASLGGERGTGHGRREWEARYYADDP